MMILQALSDLPIGHDDKNTGDWIEIFCFHKGEFYCAKSTFRTNQGSTKAVFRINGKSCTLDIDEYFRVVPQEEEALVSLLFL